MGWVVLYGAGTMIGVAASMLAGLAGDWLSWGGCAGITAYLYVQWNAAIDRWYERRCSE